MSMSKIHLFLSALKLYTPPFRNETMGKVFRKKEKQTFRKHCATAFKDFLNAVEMTDISNRIMMYNAYTRKNYLLLMHPAFSLLKGIDLKEKFFSAIFYIVF